MCKTGVWQETPLGGAVNFLTGAGGFLQSVIYLDTVEYGCRTTRSS